MADLNKVSILIKTFLRDLHLFEAISGILETMPEARIIIVDDGDQSAKKDVIYRGLELHGDHQVIRLPFDSGFGRKSNVGAAACQTEYLLIGSDDFDFRQASVRQGVERMVTVLDKVPALSLVSGRVNDNRYEGWLDDQGSRIVEAFIHPEGTSHLGSAPRYADDVLYFHCDLTVNYSLIRSSILGPDKIHWDDDVKIGGGEHGAFFVDMKRAGYKVAYVTGVGIREQVNKMTDPRYPAFRGRARQPGRPCFVRRGIKEYVLFGGQIERA